MMRVIATPVLLAMIVVACSSGVSDETTSSTTPTTTSSTSTTTLPATTTTAPPIVVSGTGGEPDLERLIQELYETAGDRPATAQASIGVFDDESRIAVVEAGEDVTLAVADPEWRIVGGWWPTLDRQTDLGTFPKIIAIVGSDARPGHDPLRSQADSIHFVAFDATGTASVLGLPRDSWIPVVGQGNMKTTTVLLRHGPDVLMKTFTSLTGIQFDGYLLTGFEGFTGLIDVLGGLDIEVPFSLSDKWSKAYIDAGRQILSAADALAFARTRKTISGGDFTRQQHGGLALIAAASMVDAMGISAVPGLMERSRGLYHTDMSAEEMILLAGALFSSDLNEVPNVVAPGHVDTTSGGASIVRLEDGAYDLFEDLSDGRLDS